ncbi:MAG: SMC-Scp complex subunit ScpB [Planctomycetota bacterium]|jgi:segregation and condensation protein B|nr:SMC-Scp complex subunit ScpB [Planctomycetota bacterium]
MNSDNGETRPAGNDFPVDAEETEKDAGGDESAAPALSFPLKKTVEAVLFAAREPLKLSHLARSIGKGIRQSAVQAAIDELNISYLENDNAFEIVEISGRFQMLSRPEYAECIRRLQPKRDAGGKAPARLNAPALETLAIIAYKQPVTRADIEHIRGVGCDSALRLLMERGSVERVGKRDVIGQPSLYGTTEAFLDEFGLGSLEELPLRSDFLKQAVEMEAGPPPALEESLTIPESVQEPA